MTTANQIAATQEQQVPIYIPRLNAANLFLIFFITSVGGAVIETVFMLAVWGELQNRSGLLWGQFSLVWGVGAILFTICLRRAAAKGPGLVFVGGAVLGSVFEYFCSWLQETCFGVRFWDYSHLPFSVGGRVNLIFSLFWGTVALFWMCFLLPALGKRLDRLPHKAVTVVSSVLAVLLAADIIISAAALWRMAERNHGVPVSNSVEEYLDEEFPNQMLFAHYSSMQPAA